MTKIISIEGNIGSGKSTLLHHLEKYCENHENIVFLKEPVDEWTQIKADGENILEKFYRDPHKYAFSFQVLAHATRLSSLKRAIETDCKLIISERSLESDKNVFAKMLHNEGKIDSVCYQIYCMNFAQDFTVDKVVYVDTAPEICFERIAKRSRSGESEISLEYLQKCDEYHKAWLTPFDKPILHLKTDAETDCMNEWIQQIVDFYK